MDAVPEAAPPVALKVKPVPPGIAVSFKRSSDGVMQVDLDVGVVRATLLVDVILALHYFVVPTLEQAAVAYGAMVGAQQRTTALQAAIGASDAQADRDSVVGAGETRRASREQVLARAAEAAARHAMAARAAGVLTLNVTVGGIEVDLIRDFHSVPSLGSICGGCRGRWHHTDDLEMPCASVGVRATGHGRPHSPVAAVGVGGLP